MIPRANSSSIPRRVGRKPGRSGSIAVIVAFVTGCFALGQQGSPQAQESQARQSSIGREISVPSHLQDGQEFSLSLEALLAHGKLLFSANWTEQEGGGRPLTKGTGRPLSDPAQPLTGMRAFNR